METAYKSGIRALKKYAIDHYLMTSEQLKIYSFDRKNGKGIEDLYADLQNLVNPVSPPPTRVQPTRNAKAGPKIGDNGFYFNQRNQIQDDLETITGVKWSVRDGIYQSESKTLTECARIIFKIGQVSKHLEEDDIWMDSDTVYVKPSRFDQL